MEMTNKKVLLLTSPRAHGWIDQESNTVALGLHTFIDTLNQEGDVEFAVSTLDKLEFSITENGVSIYDSYSAKDLNEYDIVHLRNVTLFADYARAVAIYMKHYNKRVIDETDSSLPEYGKLSQMVLYKLNGLTVPNTWASWHVFDTADLYQKKSGEFPFILKANDGIKGKDNYLVRDSQQLTEIIKANEDVQFVAQNFIPNDKDYRVLWFADHPLIFSRSASDDSHLNNTSRGGTSDEVAVDSFDPEALELARKAAELTGRLFSGADVMQDSDTGKWYVLEVNANPALTMGDMLEQKRSAYKKMIGDIL